MVLRSRPDSFLAFDNLVSVIIVLLDVASLAIRGECSMQDKHAGCVARSEHLSESVAACERCRYLNEIRKKMAIV